MFKNIMIVLVVAIVLNFIGVLNISIDPLKFFFLAMGVIFIRMLGKGLTLAKAALIAGVGLVIFTALFGM